ncbi:MAG: hypothetical protein HC843_12240 [Sphingomonadales bacterium]|nr:hypothetical protein [Sphingomonadales bacterium]
MIEILITTAKSGLIENWQEVALLSLMRLRNEIMDLGGDPILSEMADRLAASASLKNTDISSINLDQVVIPTIICLGNVRLSLFSTIAQFGSVQDVRAGEIRIELMYPHDAATENWFETVQ